MSARCEEVHAHSIPMPAYVKKSGTYTCLPGKSVGVMSHVAILPRKSAGVMSHIAILPRNLHDHALTTALKFCASEKSLHRGQKLHANILQTGLFDENVFIGNALISMYAKCGALTKMHDVFDQLSCRDAVSWNVLMTGYFQHGLGQEALHCFELMQAEGILPNEVTFLCVVNVCGNIGAIDRGKEIHAEIIRRELVVNDGVLGNALVDMYAKCGELAKAQEVLDKLLIRDVVSWTGLISGYEQVGLVEEVLVGVERMKCEGFPPDGVTYACILKACGSTKMVEKGKRIHAGIVAGGLLQSGRAIGSALVEMYVKGGTIARAQAVFNALPVRDVISWTVLISGYCQYGQGKEALQYFDQMKREGLSPDMVTFALILKACGSMGVVEKGVQIHAEIIRHGLTEKVSVLGSVLVDMYAKLGVLAKAQRAFNELNIQDVVSWTALIAGYAQHGHGNDALGCYDCMQHDGVPPNAVTFSCILKACGSVGAGDKGREIHAEIARRGLVGNIAELGNALVDMYAKCGAVVKAQEVFDKLVVRNIVSWNALITGYCQNGYGSKALNCFKLLKHAGLFPDVVTFTCILKACGSIGASGRGQTHFETMSKRYGIIPILKHRTCLMDLFCRSGHFEKAVTMLNKVTLADYSALWFTLLGACRKRGNMKLARVAFDHVV